MSGEMLIRFVECSNCGVTIAGEFGWVPHALFQVLKHEPGGDCLLKTRSVSDQQGALLNFTGKTIMMSSGEFEKFVDDKGWVAQQDAQSGLLYYLVNS
jgi:hypothetical protein